MGRRDEHLHAGGILSLLLHRAHLKQHAALAHRAPERAEQLDGLAQLALLLARALCGSVRVLAVQHRAQPHGLQQPSHLRLQLRLHCAHARALAVHAPHLGGEPACALLRLPQLGAQVAQRTVRVAQLHAQVGRSLILSLLKARLGRRRRGQPRPRLARELDRERLRREELPERTGDERGSASGGGEVVSTHEHQKQLTFSDVNGARRSDAPPRPLAHETGALNMYCCGHNSDRTQARRVVIGTSNPANPRHRVLPFLDGNRCEFHLWCGSYEFQLAFEPTASSASPRSSSACPKVLTNGYGSII